MAHGASRTRPRLVGAVLVVASALPALGAERAPIPELVTELGSELLSERENASRELLERADELSRAVGREIDPSSLTPEQRARVLATLRQRFILSPRAGLGVSFREPPVEDLLTDGVRIESVVAGFPAADLLVPGDLVIEAEGQPLRDRPRGLGDATFRHAILSLDPGEPINVRLIRNGEEMALTIPTRSYADLNQGVGQPDTRWTDGAWRLRAQRLGLEQFEIERLPLDAEQSWTAHFKMRDDVPGMTPAGRPHPLLEAERSVAALARLDADLPTITKMRLADEARVRQLRDFITERREELGANRTLLQGEMPGSKNAARLQADIRRIERQIATAQRQYKETRARLGDLGRTQD